MPVVERADAARNRAALIRSARDVFAEQGLDASLDEIARRAGTASATLYRRFASREDLIETIFIDRLRGSERAVHDSLADDDPWRGLSTAVIAVAQKQASDRGLAELIATQRLSSPSLEGIRASVQDGLVRLVDRAREAGVVRPDATGHDVLALLRATAALAGKDRDVVEGTGERLALLILDGLHTGCAAMVQAPRPLQSDQCCVG